MRILIYSYNYYPEPIGIAPLMTELAEGLVQRGHSVRVVTAMPWYPANEISPEYQGKWFLTEEKNGVKIQRCYVWVNQKRGFIHRALFELSFLFFSLFQALKGESPDIILLTIPGLPVCLPAALVGWLYRVPIILNLQDILPDAAVHVGLISNQKLIKVFEKLEQFAYATATKISVIADVFTQNLLAKGVEKDKIVEVPNWVDINFVRPLPKENNEFRHANHLDGKFIVLYSGNIALTQPLETLIEAASQLTHIPEIAIVIVGKKEALNRLRKHSEKKDATNVTLLPFQPRHELPEMLSAADVSMVIQKQNVIAFNMPSKIQVLLASGRPIIASVPEEGTAAKAINKSGGGVVIPPENADILAKTILDFYHHPEKIEKLGKEGRLYAEKTYAFDLALDRYEALFHSVLEPEKMQNEKD